MKARLQRTGRIVYEFAETIFPLKQGYDTRRNSNVVPVNADDTLPGPAVFTDKEEITLPDGTPGNLSPGENLLLVDQDREAEVVVELGENTQLM